MNTLVSASRPMHSGGIDLFGDLDAAVTCDTKQAKRTEVSAREGIYMELLKRPCILEV